ncbi:MAG: four helix bundle protein [Planctomycetes bacterium]|nr:four helix bundle protein [Planctomycetota bacterium]
MTAFEELLVWRRARVLTGDVYKLVRGSGIAHDFAFRDQIQRAVLSITANIAEGAERGQPRKFAYFLRIAKASSGELRSHLILASDLGLCQGAAAKRLQDELAQIGRMLGALIQRLA